MLETELKSALPLGVSNPNDARGVVLLVNGQLAPRVALAAGSFARLHVVNAIEGSNPALRVRLASDRGDAAEGGGGAASCELSVLALDGVFVDGPPRPRESVLLAPGGRADLAVRCDRPGAAALVSSDAGGSGFGGVSERARGRARPLSSSPSSRAPPAPRSEDDVPLRACATPDAAPCDALPPPTSE